MPSPQHIPGRRGLDDSARQNQVGRCLSSHEAGKQHGCRRREYAEANLRLAEFCPFSGEYHITGQGQFTSSSECGAVDGGHDGKRKVHQPLNNPVERLDHLVNAVRRMVCDVNTGTERPAGTRDEKYMYGRVLLQRLQDFVKLPEHRNIEHVEWRTVQSESDKTA